MSKEAVLNVAYGTISNSLNILYAPSLRLFDNLINHMDNINLFFQNDTVRNYYYDIYFANNFLMHTNETKKLSNSLHLKDLIAFHSVPPNGFKKEDVKLLQDSTHNTHKIVFGADVAQAWGFANNDKTSIIEYGVPKVVWDDNNRTKNVLVFNLENNSQIETLYSDIATNIPDSDIVRSISPNASLSNVANALSQYRVCLDFGNKINVLFCASLGIQCLTPMNISNHPLIRQITNYNNTIDDLKEVLNINPSTEDRMGLSKQILSAYNYEPFRKSITEKLTNIKNNEIFLL